MRKREQVNEIELQSTGRKRGPLHARWRVFINGVEIYGVTEVQTNCTVNTTALHSQVESITIKASAMRCVKRGFV